MASRVTQRRIAGLAGVSQTTVSLVLNGKEDAARIPEATRQRVLELIQEMTYVADPAARRLAGHSGCVRVNAVGTAWHDDDVAAVCGLPGLRQVMLPKSELPEDLAALAERLPPRVEIVALVETALGVHDATALARVPRVRRLAFGSVDFGLDAGITGTGEELLYARSRLVLASRVAGIAAPLDGVTTALDDVELLAAESARARRLGFAGKLAVHPAQIDAINRAFSPTEEEVAWARGVLAAAAAAFASATV